MHEEPKTEEPELTDWWPPMYVIDAYVNMELGPIYLWSYFFAMSSQNWKLARARRS